MENKKILLKDWLYSCNYDIDPHMDLLGKTDCKVLKTFSMNDILPWASWQEFGRHKNVTEWVIIETGHAVGFNENVSVGCSYPIKKLSKDQLEYYMGYTVKYSDYYHA